MYIKCKYTKKCDQAVYSLKCKAFCILTSILIKIYLYSMLTFKNIEHCMACTVNNSKQLKEESNLRWSSVSVWVNYVAYSSSVRQYRVKQAVEITIHPSLRLQVCEKRGKPFMVYCKINVCERPCVWLNVYLVHQSQVWLKIWHHQSCQTHHPTGFCKTIRRKLFLQPLHQYFNLAVVEEILKAFT